MINELVAKTQHVSLFSRLFLGNHVNVKGHRESAGRCNNTRSRNHAATPGTSQKATLHRLSLITRIHPNESAKHTKSPVMNRLHAGHPVKIRLATPCASL